MPRNLQGPWETCVPFSVQLSHHLVLSGSLKAQMIPRFLPPSSLHLFCQLSGSQPYQLTPGLETVCPFDRDQNRMYQNLPLSCHLAELRWYRALRIWSEPGAAIRSTRLGTARSSRGTILPCLCCGRRTWLAWRTRKSQQELRIVLTSEERREHCVYQKLQTMLSKPVMTALFNTWRGCSTRLTATRELAKGPFRRWSLPAVLRLRTIPMEP